MSSDRSTGAFFLTEEQAFCLADANGPNVPAAFLASLGMLHAEPKVTEAFRTGAGVGRHEHAEDVFVGIDAFYRPGYVPSWSPTGFPRWTALRPSLPAGAQWPTWAAVWDHHAC